MELTDRGLRYEARDDGSAPFGRVDEIVRSLQLCSPLATRTIKHIVKAGRDLPMDEARLFSEPYRDDINTGADAAEGAHAFREKRPPSWTRAVPS